MGLFAGGYNDRAKSEMDYVTIVTRGNAVDYGELTVARYYLAGVSNGTVGLFAGGTDGSYKNTIDYVTIATPGNAVDFGNLTVARAYLAGVSGN